MHEPAGYKGTNRTIQEDTADKAASKGMEGVAPVVAYDTRYKTAARRKPWYGPIDLHHPSQPARPFSQIALSLLSFPVHIGGPNEV